MKTRVVTFFCSFLLLLACSKNDDTVEPVQQTPPKETPPIENPVTVLTGKFIDAAVQGLTYTTTTQSGITTADGEFNYIEGEEITFKVGEVVLGTVTGQEQITPITLAKASDTDASIESKQAQNIAAFLQTLDNDGEENNGITISEEVIANLGVTAVDFSAPVEAVLADIVLSVVQNAGVELKLVYPSDAANKMANSLGIAYEAPENLSLTHLIPALKTYFQTWDRGFTPPSAVYRNTFDAAGNLMSIDILSRYSSKIFYSLGFNSYNEKGMPQNGTLTTYNSNSLTGAYPTNTEFSHDINFAYNEDDQLNLLSFLDVSGANGLTEVFTQYDDKNRPLSFFKDFGVNDSNRDLTITWNFTYENGLIATADRIYDELWVVDENNTYVTYTTRDFKYSYNENDNLISLDYTRIFIDESIIDGENLSSRTEASVSETFTYGSDKKLTSYIVSEDAILDSGEPFTATATRNYDVNEMIVSYNYISSLGSETVQDYEQGITDGYESYSDGLLTSEIEYLSDGGSIFTSYFYNDNGIINYKETSEYNSIGLDLRTFEYYFNGTLDFTVVEEYDGFFLTKSTGYNADGSISYVDYFSEAGFITRVDVYFEGELNYYVEYEYDANGFRTTAISSWPDGEVYGLQEFTYTALGYVDTITYSSPDNGIYLTDVYEYDVNNFVSRITGYGANGAISYILFYEYDVFVREEIYDENGVLVDVFDYTTTGKRVVTFKNSKEKKSNKLNDQRSFSIDLDRMDIVPNSRFSGKNKVIKKPFNSMIEQRVSNKIRSLRIGQRK